MSVQEAMMEPVAHRTRTLVGRDAELSTLVDLLGVMTASEQAPTTHVVLGGDAGVGKTRLIDELARQAQDAGWQAYVGHCVDFADGTVAFLPFSEVLGRLDLELPDVVDTAVTAAPALARLRPVRRRLDADVPDPVTSGAGDRSSLFAGVHLLLEAAAEKAPVLVVVEDAHWADPSTRELLTYLFTRPFQGPVSVLASYRADDLHRRHPLRRLVTEWARLPQVERMVLDPLPDEALRTMLRELDPRIDAAAAEAIVRRAEGNAFFVEELLDAGEGPDHWLPDELADVLLVRLDRLDEAARSVVRTASVAGRSVAHDLLATVCGLGETEFEAAVRAAVDANALVASDDHFFFRHALLAEAVYDDLLPGQRVRLHGAYAAALATLPGRGTAAELAHHARRAGDLAAAVTASIQAGDEAATLGGPQEAAQHYETALALVAEAGLADVTDVGVLSLKAAGALSLAGHTLRAVGLLGEQLRRIPDLTPELRAQMLADRALYQLALEPGTEPMEQSAEAVALLSEDAPAVVRARVLADRAHVLARYGEEGEAESVALEALEVAERHDLAALAAEALTTLSGLHRSGPQEPLRAALGQAIERAAEAGSLMPELRGLYLLGRSHQDEGDLGQAARLFRRAIARGDEVGTPWAPYAAEARWQLIAICVVTGDWDEALALGDTAAAPALLAALLDAVTLGVRHARGEDVTARAVALRRHWPDDGAVAINSVAVEMLAAGRRGDAAAVLEAYDAGVEHLGRVWKPWFSGQVRLAAVAVAELARLLPGIPAAERPALLSRIDRLHADGHSVLVNNNDPHWGPEGRAWTKRLDAETLRARWLGGTDVPPSEVLVGTWRECERLFDDYGHVYELAQVRARLAGILRATGDLAAARQTADLARASAHRLGAQPLLDDLVTLGSAPVRTPGAGAPTTLTPREREILELVAAGRSNGEIGRQLFISTKTVSVHVSNILGKLGAAGRTEAAALGRRRGLIE